MRSVALERETRTPRVATRDATVRAGQKVPHGRPSDAVGPARRARVAPGGLRELRGDCPSCRRSGSALGMNHTGTAAQPRRVGTARCRGSTSIAGDGLSRPSWQTTGLTHAPRIPLPVVTHLSTQREQARHGASCGGARLPCNPHPTHDAGTFDSGGIVVFWARRKRAGQTRRPALSNRETGGCVGCSAVTKAQARAKNRGAKPDAAKTRVDGVFSANRPRLPVVLGRSFTPVTWVQIPPGTLPFSCSHSPGWLLTAGGRLMSPAPCPRPARRRPGCASPR